MKSNEIESQKKLGDIIQKLWSGLKSYLTDWRNLLGHASLGVLLLVLAIWVPVQIWFKLITIAALITFNIMLMRHKAYKADTQIIDEVSDEPV